MKRFLTSSRVKTGLVVLGGTGLAVSRWAYLNQDPNSEAKTTFWRPHGFSNIIKRHFVSADSMTTSVLDPKLQRPAIPWDINWDKYEIVLSYV